MPPYRSTLNRVGIVLIVLGVLDIGFMIYSIKNGESYSSSFNVFSVAAGIFLLRGSLDTVRFVTWFLAFFLGGAGLGSLVLFPFINPPGLWLVMAKLQSITFTFSAVLTIALFYTLVWVYRKLRQPEVVQARIAAGQSGKPPTLAFVLGGLVSVVLAATMYLTMTGPSAEIALGLARQALGDDYRYAISRISQFGAGGSATVTAYNDDEIRSIDVQW